MKVSTLLTLIVFSSIFFSCDKDKKTSKRFFSVGQWTITEFQIDQDWIHPHRKVKIDSCSIYEEQCSGNWSYRLGTTTYSANFNWQFNEKAKKFVLQGPGHCGTCTEETDLAANELNLISGTYHVTTNTKTQIHVESTTTWGYPGKRVFLKFEKNP